MLAVGGAGRPAVAEVVAGGGDVDDGRFGFDGQLLLAVVAVVEPVAVERVEAEMVERVAVVVLARARWSVGIGVGDGRGRRSGISKRSMMDGCGE